MGLLHFAAHRQAAVLMLAGLVIFFPAFSNTLPMWVANIPSSFQSQNDFGNLTDFRNDMNVLKEFKIICNQLLNSSRSSTDYEPVDALEHFFWGFKNGLSFEMGALDGTDNSESATVILEQKLGWNRILVEGNPTYKEGLIKFSPDAFSVNAVICNVANVVHYLLKPYIGGIFEFMHINFLKQHWPEIILAVNTSAPKYDWEVGEVIWSSPALANLYKTVACIPLRDVFKFLAVSMNLSRLHINYFVLDVEGGEKDVLGMLYDNLVFLEILSSLTIFVRFKQIPSIGMRCNLMCCVSRRFNALKT